MEKPPDTMLEHSLASSGRIWNVMVSYIEWKCRQCSSHELMPASISLIGDKLMRLVLFSYHTHGRERSTGMLFVLTPDHSISDSDASAGLPQRRRIIPVAYVVS